MSKNFVSHRLTESSAAPAPEAQPVAEPKAKAAQKAEPSKKPKELGGPSGPEPTRYGDWERKGICYDF